MSALVRETQNQSEGSALGRRTRQQNRDRRSPEPERSKIEQATLHRRYGCNRRRQLPGECTGRGGEVAAVGTGLSADGTNTVDASDKLVMPGFIDAHTQMDMPFGGTVTADDWATGTAAAVAGGRRLS